ncbi:MAG: hypothetical protein HY698_06135 [Deltaproteobacteria bacterium]|nr:hypothetical protein [Deltaproteobacteria bacterium]
MLVPLGRRHDPPMDAATERQSRISLPREHGAYLTLVGATIAGALAASDPAPAVAAGFTLGMAFLARGVLDRLVVGLPLREWDATAVVLMACALGEGARIAGSRHWGFTMLAVACALALTVSSVMARRARKHRHLLFELLGLGILGTCAGIIGLAGGLVPKAALALAAVLGAHAASSVPVVRGTVRKGLAPPMRFLAACLGLILIAGALAFALGIPLLAAALVPRLADSVVGLTSGFRHARPAVVGVRETVYLFIVLVVVSVAL